MPALTVHKSRNHSAGLHPQRHQCLPCGGCDPETLAKVVATAELLSQQSAKPAPGGKDGLQAALDNKMEGTQLSPAKTTALQVSGMHSQM